MNAKRKGIETRIEAWLCSKAPAIAVRAAPPAWATSDVIGIGPADVVLVQLKTNAWSGAAQMERLRAFSMPPNCRKLIHRWPDRNCRPDVREVGA